MLMTDGQLASLAVVAKKHREREDELRRAGEVSGLAIGAAALLIEMAGDEIKTLRAENGKLRAAFRANMLRYAPVGEETQAEIDRVLSECSDENNT